MAPSWSPVLPVLFLAFAGVRACPPGSGGPNCDWNMKMLYFEHDVYKDIREKPPRPLDLTGWSPNETIYHELAAKANATVMIEVGVWKGLSASHLASYLRKEETGDRGGVLFAVDTWLGAKEFWDRPFTNGAFDPSRDLQWKDGYPTVYWSFISNMVLSNVSDYVVPFPVPSRMAAEILSGHRVQADIIHIDAAHEYHDVLEDLRMWWPLVRPCGGVFFGDDYPGWAGVAGAVDEWAKHHDLKVENRDPKWVIVKPCQ